MKRLSVIVLSSLLLAVCCVREADLSYLQKQIDDLKSDQIASINNQITSIQISIGRLEGADIELRGYIQTLNEQRTALERADKDLAQSITDLKAELEGEITAAQSSILSQLEADRTTIASQINALSNSIEALEAKDIDLQNQITNLKSYVNGGIQSCKDWVSATFVTLEQYNATATAVSGIQAQITIINQQIQQLSDSQALLTTNEELNQALSTLDSSLQAKIQTAIASCESSLKTWINQQLAGYYTIAETDALLEALSTSLEGQLSAQNNQLGILIDNVQSSVDGHKSSIDSLRSRIGKLEEDVEGLSSLRADLDSSKKQITRAYQKSIQEAITNLDGKITAQIAEEVSTINSRIDNEVSQINEALTALSNRVSQCETDIQSLRDEINGVKADITKLLARIQSLTYVPRYSDGKARVIFDKEGDVISADPLSLDFEVHPNSVAGDLASVWTEAITLKAVSTITTKAEPSFINLDILSLVANGGIISLTVEPTSLPASFFNGDNSINACLGVSDGTNDLVSEYVPVLAINRNISVETLPATNVNTGTATLNGSIKYFEEITPTEIGFYYGRSPEALSSNGTKVTCELQQDGTFKAVLTNLEDGVTYYVAYSSVGSKTYYGETKNFAILTTIDVDGAVDLGLSVLWATCNVGGENPEDYGNYYAWGETGLKESYTYWTYKWSTRKSEEREDDVLFKRYNVDSDLGVVDNLIRLLPEDDVAHKKLGGKWRTPTEAEWRELIKECNWSQTTINNFLGLVAERNGKCIFLPLAGSRISNLQYYQGGEGDYWSADLCVENPTLAISCYFEQGPSHFTTGYYSRAHGYSVRPVYDPNYSLVSSITLDKTSLSLKRGSSATINATINPSEATYKSLLWTSSDESVATVNADGKVTSVANGNATITATASDGSGVEASCEVHVISPTPPAGAVDLGLSVYWATCNVGASKPEEYGDHFAWGETAAKECYLWDGYQLCDGDAEFLNKYNYDKSYGVVDNKYVLEPEDDVAHVRLGGKWRIPTSDECEELIDLCTSIWTTANGVSGRRFTGPNGNSIFLPAAGYTYAVDPIHDEGDRGCYWTSDKGTRHATTAKQLNFSPSGISVYDGHPRCEGLTVRPVTE